MSERDDKIYKAEIMRKHEVDDFEEEDELEEEDGAEQADDDDNPDDPELFDPFDEDSSSSISRADELDQHELESVQNQIKECFIMLSLEGGKPFTCQFDRSLTYNEVRIIPEVSEIDFSEGHTEVIVYNLKDFKQKTRLHQRYPDIFFCDERGLSLRTFKDFKKIN